MVFFVASCTGGLKVGKILSSTFGTVANMVNVQGIRVFAREVFVYFAAAPRLLAESSATLEDFVPPYAHVLAS